MTTAAEMTFEQLTAHYGNDYVTETGHTIARIWADVTVARARIQAGDDLERRIAEGEAKHTGLGGIPTIRAAAFAEMLAAL